MNKIQMEQQIKIAKEGIEVLDKWAETLDAEALEEKREQIDKAKAYCEDCLEASQTLIEAIEAIEATEPKKEEVKKDEPKKEEKPKRRRAPAKKKEEPITEPCPPAAAADDLDDLF